MITDATESAENAAPDPLIPSADEIAQMRSRNARAAFTQDIRLLIQINTEDVPKLPSGVEQLGAKLRESLRTLERVPCQFWACDGPDAPFVDMKTCYVCADIQDLRKVLSVLFDGTEAS